tara:strand:+ start:3403 stop:4071 length:669 start_codon:yes stop_codon:yes gene_type:complete
MINNKKICLLGNFKFKNINDIFEFDFFKNFFLENLKIGCIIIKNKDVVQQEEVKIDYKDQKIDILIVKKFNCELTKNFLNKQKPDIGIYGGGKDIFSKEILEIPKLGIFGCHFGELPFFKGLDTVEWTLFMNKELYISVHKFGTEIDCGSIFFKQKINYDGFNNFEDIRKCCNINCMQILPKITKKIISGDFIQVENDKAYKKYYRMHKNLKKYLKKKLNFN